MKIEIRADNEMHISGYVNVTGKKSRAVVTPHGRCIEVIEERAFDKAIAKSGNITVTVDHTEKVYADTENRTLSLHEDAIGLYADVKITDKNLINMAKQGKIKGWSFGMYDVVDEIEQRADELPIRHVREFTLDHITLVKDKIPCYAATSVEYRADNDVDIENRAFDTGVDLHIKNKVDYSKYEERLMKI